MELYYSLFLFRLPGGIYTPRTKKLMEGSESILASNGSDSDESTSTYFSSLASNYQTDRELDIENRPLPIQPRPDRPLAGQIREPKERHFRTAEVT